jgi:primosomal protein N' (replication factor Y)
MTQLSTIRVALPGPFLHGLDYLTENTDNLLGCRVKVPLGKREIIGIVVKLEVTPDCDISKLKPILERIDDTPLLPQDLNDLIRWLSDYYHHPIGECFYTALPGRITQGKGYTTTRSKAVFAPETTPNKPLTLSSEQQTVFDALKTQTTFSCTLLEGVTGSGKTEVYLQLISEVLQHGKQALVLVPEIGLTPQTLSRFSARFDVPIVALHSGLTDTQKALAHGLTKTGEAKIVVGTRSALFTPFESLGIIIVDETHDGSYKQQSGLRYSARDAAIKRAKLNDIPIILGSATPSLETLHNALGGRYQYFKLTQRAQKSVLPTYHLINIQGHKLQSGLAKPLIDEIKKTLDQNQQVLLFINRRGFAPMLLCHHCNWQAKCMRCERPYTLHLSPPHLVCHHCAGTRAVPKKCQDCGKEELIHLGAGTEQIEAGLKEMFPDKNILRIDRSVTQKKGDLEALLEAAHSGKADILVGTQMLSKGHHFKNVTMVGVLDMDGALYSQDFRALEHMSQLLTQVSGRAGRESIPGNVFIQTHQMDHPLLRMLLKHGYHNFAKTLLEERQDTDWPPFSFLALLACESHKQPDCLEFLKLAKATLNQTDVLCLGPVPAILAKKAGKYRMQLLVQGSTRQALHQALEHLCLTMLYAKQRQKVKWTLDVDPISLS